MNGELLNKDGENELPRPATALETDGTEEPAQPAIVGNSYRVGSRPW